MDFRNAWHRDSDANVCCIACGETVDRSEAREYDKYGDRWNRDDKTFEYLCTACYRETCRVDRDGLEARLTRAGAGSTDRARFLAEYYALADESSAEHGRKERRRGDR